MMARSSSRTWRASRTATRWKTWWRGGGIWSASFCPAPCAGTWTGGFSATGTRRSSSTRAAISCQLSETRDQGSEGGCVLKTGALRVTGLRQVVGCRLPVLVAIVNLQVTGFGKVEIWAFTGLGQLETSDLPGIGETVANNSVAKGENEGKEGKSGDSGAFSRGDSCLGGEVGNREWGTGNRVQRAGGAARQRVRELAGRPGAAGKGEGLWSGS